MHETPLVAGTLYREIRERILSGYYLPGTVLRQQDIAGQFETSRVPLREAFSKLEAEGFLTQRPQRGYAVMSLSPADMIEIFDMRAVMERHAGQLATRQQRPEDSQALEVIFAQMAATQASQVGGLAEWCGLHAQFYDRLFACCQRPRLQHILRQLRDQVEPYLRMNLRQSGDLLEAARDHEEIFLAFRSGDADLVGELCAVHCSRTATRLLEDGPPVG